MQTNNLGPDFGCFTGGAGTPRPVVASGCNTTISGSATSRLGEPYNKITWFNAMCFSQHGNYAYGNEPCVDSSLKSQGIDNFDFALFKTTPIMERMGIQFRTEVFNLFNRVQFSPPGTECCAAPFGDVTSQANNPRLIQFGLRLTY